jgi:K+-sensing histidine kinase KdpD
MADTRAALLKLRHDLSNPLSAILAETQILLLTPEKFDEETLSSLKQIEDLARKMRQMLLALE